jgi:hypothetical protein
MSKVLIKGGRLTTSDRPLHICSLEILGMEIEGSNGWLQMIASVQLLTLWAHCCWTLELMKMYPAVQHLLHSPTSYPPADPIRWT